MPAPITTDEFVHLIRRSTMIDEAKLDAYLAQRRQSRSLPDDVRKLAGMMITDGILTYFQAEQFLMGKWRGFTIGKYKLLERIGFGGMGQVFLCEHMYMHRRVAIKILPPAKAEEPSALGRFYREARASGLMDHPNIVRTFDIDQDNNLHFMVMEYIDGSSLLDIVRRFGPFSVLRAAHYIRQAAEGLQHAHMMGLIHRDIKPGNILVDREGVVKILDLGLARIYHDTTDMLTVKYDDKSVLGTADYVAPEQILNSHAADIRADIYGLGATFYFTLAGHPPFPEGLVSQKLTWHQTKEPTPIEQIRPDVPPGLAAIIRKMMAKSVNQRYQTPAEVVEALAPFTAIPIPPPPANEMPMLSPAAMPANAPPVDAHVRSSADFAVAATPRTPEDAQAIRDQFFHPAATPIAPAMRSPVETRKIRDANESTAPVVPRPAQPFAHPFVAPPAQPPKKVSTLLVVLAAILGALLALILWLLLYKT